MKLGLSAGLVLAVASLAGCGYHAAFGGSRASYRLTVVSAPLAVPQPQVLQAVLAGVRAELGKDGALESGSGYPRLVVELLRVDELAAGIAATSVGDRTLPLARASAIGVSARGFIEEKPGGEAMRDTGDVRAVETVAQGEDPLSGSLAAAEAARAAGRRAGQSVARRALGMAEPGVEPM